MTETEYRPCDHINAAQGHLSVAVGDLAHGRVDHTRDSLVHARASITRALLLLPYPEEPDAA